MLRALGELKSESYKGKSANLINFLGCVERRDCSHVESAHTTQLTDWDFLNVEMFSNNL